jgi:hypothetical protein
MSKRIPPERYVPVIKYLISTGWTDNEIHGIMKVTKDEIKMAREDAKNDS